MGGNEILLRRRICEDNFKKDKPNRSCASNCPGRVDPKEHYLEDNKDNVKDNAAEVSRPHSKPAPKTKID